MFLHLVAVFCLNLNFMIFIANTKISARCYFTQSWYNIIYTVKQTMFPTSNLKSKIKLHVMNDEQTRFLLYYEAVDIIERRLGVG